MIRAIIMGPPGSGKGTISNMLVKTFGVKHISSGDLLRLYLQNSTTSSPVKLAMKRGELIPDSIVEEVVLFELKKYSHWLLDGYPRTLVQAKSLMKQKVEVDMMINLNVPDQTIIERLQGRWIHVASGRIYNTAYNPPKIEGVDDVTGEPLEKREDDHPDTVQHRLNTYHDLTNPVLGYFKQLGLLKVYTGTESMVLWPQIRADVMNMLNH